MTERNEMTKELLQLNDELGFSGGCRIILRDGIPVPTDLFEELNDANFNSESD